MHVSMTEILFIGFDLSGLYQPSLIQLDPMQQANETICNGWGACGSPDVVRRSSWSRPLERLQHSSRILGISMNVECASIKYEAALLRVAR
jgi:hypothetical protein